MSSGPRLDNYRILAYSVAAVALIFAGFLYVEQGFIGFPDGHLTALDRAERALFRFAIAVNLIASFAIAVLAFALSHQSRRWLILAIGVYLALGFAMIGVDVYFRLVLERGGGG